MPKSWTLPHARAVPPESKPLSQDGAVHKQQPQFVGLRQLPGRLGGLRYIIAQALRLDNAPGDPTMITPGPTTPSPQFLPPPLPQ